jgi:isoleucyl-tRNA synthetase
LNGRAPYLGLLTHGFTVDGQGKKMSKSLGNVIAPQKVSDTLGAEILRLWVGTADYTGEMSISDEILKRVVESYRRIRNTLRFLLANTADFEAGKHALPVDEWLEIDRYVLVLTEELQKKVLAHYAKFEFQPAMQAIQNFCSEDLGGFYLDILKDRLYTAGAKSQPRRAAQSALHHILQALTRLIAPVLSFTAEEIWNTLNAGADESVFLHRYYALPAVPVPASLQLRWTRLREIRAVALKSIEDQRAAGAIGSSLQGELEFSATGADFDLLASLENDLRLVMITSAATVHKAIDAGPIEVVVRASTHPKCERCWHYRAEVGLKPEHPTLCGRCVSNLFGEGEKRFYA